MKYEIDRIRLSGESLLLTLRIPLPELELSADEIRQSVLTDRKGYKWATIPNSVVDDYLAGSPVLALAHKYNTSTASVTRKLRSMGVKIRHTGCAVGSTKPGKLTAEQVSWAIEKEGEMTQAEIGRELGVSREYIRQICLRAGNVTLTTKRAEAMVDGATAVSIAVNERKAAQLKFVETISELYRGGASLSEIAVAAGRKPSSQSGHHVVHALRQKYPAKFPHRQPNHWKLKTPTLP